MLKGHLLAATAIVALIPVIAHAQPQPQPPGPGAAASSAPRTEDQTLVGEIVVTAQRREERLLDVPMAAVAQSGAQLAAAGVTSTRDLQRVVPGLTFTTQGAWAQPNLRGVTTVSSGAGAQSPIAIYVDGVYQSSQIGSLFELPDTERIEVLKGPQGTLFGRNATGGAIQIVTKQASFVPTGSVTAKFGYFTGAGGSDSSGEYELKGFFSGPLVADKLAGSVSFQVGRVDGFLHNVVTNHRDGEITNGLGRVKLLFTPTDDLSFELIGYYIKKKDYANTTPFPLNGFSASQAFGNAILATRPWQTSHDNPTFINTEARGLTLRGTYATDAGTLTSISGYNNVRNVVSVDVDAAFLPPGPGRDTCFAFFSCIWFKVRQPQEMFSQEFDFASRKFGDLAFVAGAYFYSARDGSGSDIQAGVVDNFARVKTTAYAVFAEGTYDLTDRLSLIAGARYSWEKQKGTFKETPASPAVPNANANWDSINPRVSVRYSLDDNSNVYATYSQGFKSGVINPSPPFEVTNPEKLSAVEVGYKRNTHRYSVAASVFYYDYKDLQVQSFNGISTLTTNAATAKIYGIDLDGTIRATDELDFRLAVSYLPTAKYSKYTTATFYGFCPGTGQPAPVTGTFCQFSPVDVSGKRMIRTPKVTGTLAANYHKDIRWGELEANASLYYSDSFVWELGYRVKTDRFASLNAQISLRPANTNVRVTLFGKNLGNEDYVQGVVESASADMGVFGAPRQVGVELNYSF